MLFRSLRFSIHQLGLTNCVSLLGKQSHQQVAQQLQAHALYLQPSLQEGFCNAVLEAQAAGLLCVVTDAEGLQENVLHGETGLVVPKRNPQAIADAIQEIIAWPEEQRQVTIRRAQERVRREFNLPDQIEKFDRFYTAVD